MSDEQQRWPEPVYLTKDHAINMPLRDYFAAKAMQALIIANGPTPTGGWPTYAERTAYTIADAMMKAREK